MSSNGDIVSSATCAVFIDGKIQGTAWLASRNGHLLTAGHILGRESPIDKVYVRFGNGELKLAMKVFWMYNRENGMDFAVLRLKKYFPDQQPMSLRFISELPLGSRIRTYGYAYAEAAGGGPFPGEGRYINKFNKQTDPNQPLFTIGSAQMGAEGFSGSAIYCDDLNAVVALQHSALQHGSNVPGVFALPLFRIAVEWPQIFDEFALDSSEFRANVNDFYYPTSPNNLPQNIDELVDSSYDLKREIQREAGVESLRRFFTGNFSDRSNQKHVILYHGLSQIGKTYIMEKLEVEKPLLLMNISAIKYAGQNIDIFLYNLLEEIIEKISRAGNEAHYDYKWLSLNDFKDGNGKSAFLKHWNDIINNSSIVPVLIIDQLDELISEFSDNNEVLSFIVEFIQNPDNGFFIIPCKESVLRAGNEYVQKITECAEILNVITYKKGTTLRVLKLLRQQGFLLEDANLESYIEKYCDEFPFAIRIIINTLIDRALKKKKHSIDLEDVDLAIDDLIGKYKSQLKSVFWDLSELERISLWNLSRLDKVELLNNDRGGLFMLNRRQWISHEQEFNFRLLLVLVKKYYSKIEEVYDANR